MNRTLKESCPICDDDLKCIIIIGNLGDVRYSKRPVNKVYIYWGVGQPQPPPQAKTEDFIFDCPWCDEEIECQVVIPFILCDDIDAIDIQLIVKPEEESKLFRCNSCSERVPRLFGASGICRECYISTNKVERIFETR